MNHNFSFYKAAIEKLFHIVNKDMEAVPFKLNPPQSRMLKELDGSRRDIILKARKEGISSLIGAMFLVDWLTVENVKCVMISHEDKATQRLFDRVRYFLDSLSKTWPGELPYKTKYNSKYEIVNTMKNSTFYVGTAGAKAFGRGDDIHNLHISELSSWPEQERLMLSVTNSVTSTGRIIIETTANGIGDYFYSMCIKARSGNSPYKFHFIPWFEDPTNVMPYKEPLELTPEEQNLINAYGLKRDQIAWRRWKINEGNGDWTDPATWDNFNQENPANADEAFIVSGNPVFSPMAIKHYLTQTKKPIMTGYLRGFDPVTIEPNEKAYLKIWRTPNQFHTYAIGVDVAEGKAVGDEGGRERDASCAQVFDKHTYEQVAVWYGRIDSDQLGVQLDLLGRYYNEALIGVERNAVGVTPLIKLRDLNYPNLYYRERMGLITEKITGELGWLTDSISKESLISDAVNLLRDKRLILYDEDTLTEMRSFMRDSDGHARAAKSAYDDRCFVAGTKILTDRGQVAIEKIKVNDFVLTRKGFKPVVAIGNRLEDVIYNKMLNLTGTPDHPIITKGGIVRLDNTKASDIIYIWNEKQSSIMEKSIIDILNQKENNSESIFGNMIHMVHQLLYTAKFGLTTLVKSLKDIWFIIKTKILLIMPLGILAVSVEKNMIGYMTHQNAEGGMSKLGNHNLQELSKPFGNGNSITLKKQRKYISKMGKIKLKELFNLLISGGKTILKKQEEFVKKMEEKILQITGVRRRVYNLQVADCHEYFANNVLVHNCMALLISLRMLSKAKSTSSRNEIEQEDIDASDKGFYMGGNSFDSRGMPTSPENMDGFSGEEI